MDHSYDSPDEPRASVTERVTSSSRTRRYLVAAALLSGGVTLGAVVSPIGLANAQSDDTTASTTDDSGSGGTTDDDATNDADGRSRGEGRGRGHHGGAGMRLETLATVLGLSTDELRTEIAAGKTLAEIAEARGVSEDDLVAAMVDHMEEHLDEAVADGRIEQSEADTRLADAEQAFRDRLDDVITLKDGPGGRGFGGMRGDLRELADSLGLDLDTLRQAVMEGQTVAEAAAAQGVEADELKSALVESATTHIDEALAAGRIDQAKADALKADLEARIDDVLNGSMADGFGLGGRGGNGFGPGGHGHGPGSGHKGGAGDGSAPGDSTPDASDEGETQESGYTA